jgi:fructose-1,6-bisphosphatase/inositol monophosphatase family enzyme
MEERLKLAFSLSKKAGGIIKDNFGKTHAVVLKDDASPVTEVDQRINKLVAQSLKESFPEDGLLGEEESYGTGHEKYQWICDPLDGTKPFILGLPLSVFMLALSENGKMLLSVVYDPYSDKMYHAIKGEGAFCNDEPIKVSSEKIDEGYALVGADSFSFAAELKKLSRGIEPVPGTGYKFLMIATGRGIGMINDSADFHDIGPGSLIVEEAGGKVTGLNGEELDYSKEIGGVVVSNGVVHDDFLKIAASH